MAKFVEDTWLETVACCTCGMMFAMTSDFMKRRRDDHDWWYCPKGHQQHFTGKTTAEKLRDELERKQSDLADARERANRLMAERDKIAKSHNRMRTRVANGVCPCCNRSFENLRMHMKSEHSDFGEQKTLFALRTAFGMTQEQVAYEAGVSAPHVSNYERGKPVSANAKQRMDRWVENQAATA